ncbi:hypothetical protein H4Q26_013053 [Puccinia striiformis f. sp. tritici PST-130]|nr:hypothetical protein H4Q26_013053 [Puccinia striiformis f. sp. tritici PST-130]
MSMMLSEGIKVVVYGLTEKDNELHINDPSAITQAIDHLIATPELTITRTSHVFQSISDLPFPKIFRKAWFYHWNQLHILATRPFSHVANNFQKIDAKLPTETEQQETVVKTNAGHIKKDGIWHNISLTKQEQEFLSKYVDRFPRTDKDLDKIIPEGSESVADIYNKMANSEDSRTDK